MAQIYVMKLLNHPCVHSHVALGNYPVLVEERRGRISRGRGAASL